MLNDEAMKGIEKINLNYLNQCIEENERNMVSRIKYDFLEQISRLMLQKINIRNEKNIVPVLLFSREKAISIVLNFFDSLDHKEWYEQAKNIILGQNKNIGINIFRDEDIKDFFEKDNNGFYKYSNGSEVEYKENGSKALIKILLNDELRDVKDCIPNDKFTLQDIYDTVHEISHTFDLGNDSKSISKRELFTEITPYCFEKMLGYYLIDNNIVNERVVDKIVQRRTEVSLRRARAVCTKVNLIKIREKEGRITKDNIKEMLKENNIQNPFYVQSMISDVLESVPIVDYDARYPIAELTVHQYIKMYRNNKKQATKKLKIYCEEIKKGNSSNETLKLIGCPTNEKEVEKAIGDIIDAKNR